MIFITALFLTSAAASGRSWTSLYRWGGVGGGGDGGVAGPAELFGRAGHARLLEAQGAPRASAAVPAHGYLATVPRKEAREVGARTARADVLRRFD